MNKKVVRATLICLGIILGLILIENAIRGSVKVAEHVAFSPLFAVTDKDVI